MKRRRTVLENYYVWRARYWYVKRYLFPSPAEVRFMRLMGAKLFTLGWLKSTPQGFPLTLVLSRGKILRRAKIKREVRIGRCWTDFANDLYWCIEIDGSPWHQDVVADFDREVYMKEYLLRQHKDMRILRIPAPRLWHDSAGVQRDVLKFLAA